MRQIQDAYVGIVNSEEASQSRALKHLFTESDGPWFTEIKADGNEHHVDYWPDEILVIVAEGKVKLAMSANGRYWP